MADNKSIIHEAGKLELSLYCELLSAADKFQINFLVGTADTNYNMIFIHYKKNFNMIFIKTTVCFHTLLFYDNTSWAQKKWRWQIVIHQPEIVIVCPPTWSCRVRECLSTYLILLGREFPSSQERECLSTRLILPGQGQSALTPIWSSQGGSVCPPTWYCWEGMPVHTGYCRGGCVF